MEGEAHLDNMGNVSPSAKRSALRRNVILLSVEQRTDHLWLKALSVA